MAEQLPQNRINGFYDMLRQMYRDADYLATAIDDPKIADEFADIAYDLQQNAEAVKRILDDIKQ